MKFKIEQKKLNDMINKVQKAVNSKTTLPILNGILFECQDGSLTATATDLEIGIKAYTDEVEIESEGAVVIDAKMLGNMVKKLPNEKVFIEIVDNKAKINCLMSSFEIITNSAFEYPELPSISDGKTFDIEGSKLKKLIDHTIYAVAKDNFRPALTGCLLETENNKVAMVGLDGYRLALDTANVFISEDVKVIIPANTLNEVSRLLQEDIDVKVQFTDSHILFDLGDTVIISRLLEGEYIDYKRIISPQYKAKVSVDSKSLKDVLSRALTLARDSKNHLIKMIISDDKMTIKSNNEVSSSIEQIPIELEGEEMEIGFNSTYIYDAINSIDTDMVEMKLVNPVSPCIINPINDDAQIGLVLPVRTNN